MSSLDPALSDYRPTFYIKKNDILSFLTEISSHWNAYPHVHQEGFEHAAQLITNMKSLLKLPQKNIDILVLIFDYYRRQIRVDVMDADSETYIKMEDQIESYTNGDIIQYITRLGYEELFYDFNKAINGQPIEEFWAFLNYLTIPFNKKNSSLISHEEYSTITGNISRIAKFKDIIPIYRALLLSIDEKKAYQLENNLSLIKRTSEDSKEVLQAKKEIVDIIMEYINSEKLGYYWTDNIEMANAHWGSGNVYLVLNAQVHSKDVDWLATILCNIFICFEKEIRIFPKTYIRIEGFSFSRDKNYVFNCTDNEQCLAYV